jgi:hypothetical protein
MKTRKAKGYQLFNNNPKGLRSRVKAAYGSAEKARKTIKALRGKPAAYQRQVATTMYYRAKYHKYRTEGMRNAMDVYGKFLKKF